ncbi:MAG: Ig domain-containing protein, partial [Gemmatimonadaceae bacterium]
MSPRNFVLAVTGFVICVAACSTYTTSVVEVKGPPHVASIAVALNSPTLRAGQTQRATATVKDANGAILSDRAVAWSTSSVAVATANDSGVIVAIAPGTTVVTAAADGVSGQTTLTVSPPTPTPVAALSVAISPAAVLVGQTAHATAVVMDSTGSPLTNRTITWQ